MKIGQKVKLKPSGKIVTVLGPIEKYGVKWILVACEDKIKAIVLENYLETINEVR